MPKLAVPRRHQSMTGVEQSLREASARDDGPALPLLQSDPPNPQPGATWVHLPSRTLRVRIGSTTYKAALTAV